MAQNAIVQSIKTITESLIRKAGFDKTRSGKVVGVNSLTNTYSVKVDGHVYNNVRVVNDSTYNVGDTVRINIPVNQMSQAYISASIFSDASIGKKIGHAESLIEAADREISDIIEIMGKIYQLSIRSEYTQNSVTHYGVMMQNGEDVTSSEYTNNFHWYLQKTTGKTAIGTGASVTLDTEDFLYGQAVLLEWVVDNVVQLRAQVILFDNTKVEEVAEKAYDAYDIATNEAQYFWFNSDTTDNGAHISYYPQVDFETNPRGHNLLANADGVAIRNGVATLSAFTENGMYVNGMLNNSLQLLAHYGSDGIWFNEGIGYKIGNNSAYVKYEYDDGWKIKISADQITLGNQQVATTDMIVNDVPYLTEISSGGLFVHRADTGYNGTVPTASTAYGVQLASTVDIIRAGKSLATFDTNAVTFRTSNGYKTADVGTNGLKLYRGTSTNNYALATFNQNGMTLSNTSGITTVTATAGGFTLYNGNATTNVALCEIGTSGMRLRNTNNKTLATILDNGVTLYDSNGYTLVKFNGSGCDFYADNKLSMSLTQNSLLFQDTVSSTTSAIGFLSFDFSDNWTKQISLASSTDFYDYCSMNLRSNEYGNHGSSFVLTTSKGTSSSNTQYTTVRIDSSSVTVGIVPVGYGSYASASVVMDNNSLAFKNASGVSVLSLSSTANTMTLSGHDSPVGSVLTKSQSSDRGSSTNLANLSGAYIDLTAGSWVLTLRCGGDINSADKRLQFEVYNTTDETEYTSTRTTLHTSNTGAVSGQCTLVININQTKRFYCRCYQNSGATVTLAAYFRAIRIA